MAGAIYVDIGKSGQNLNRASTQRIQRCHEHDGIEVRLMSPFRALGIKKSASIPEIKRAYAAQLKLNRPDDDPAAFQKLREAFDAALYSAKQRDLQHAPKNITVLPEIDDVSTNELNFKSHGRIITESSAENFPVHVFTADPKVFSSEEPAREITISVQIDDPFDFDEFIDELQKAADFELPAFEQWLVTNPKLYSLSTKAKIIHPLMHYLSEASRPLLPKWLSALMAFFQLDTVASRSYDLEFWIESAQQHSELFWKPETIALQYADGRGTWIDRLLLNELKEKNNKPRHYLILLLPSLKARIRKMAEQFIDIPIEYQQRVINPDSLQFWFNASEPSHINGRDALVVAVTWAMIFSVASWVKNDLWQLFLVIASICYVGWILLAWLRVKAYRDSRQINRIITGSSFPDFNWRWIWALLVLANLCRHLF
ncbi:MAG: hypothetical protein ABI644_04445 [Arenimonas sp.]